MAEDNWKDSLPLDLKTNDSLNKFKDLGSFAKSYLDLEQFVSSTGRVPKDDSKPEDWDKYYKHWGRPEKPEYKMIDLPQEYQLDDKFKGAIMSMAHQLGLNQKQFDKLISWGLEQSKGIYENNQKIMNDAISELKNEWGYRFDSNKERAHKTIAMLVDYKADHPFVKWLESTGNDNNPVVLKFFRELADDLGEDNFVDETVKKDTANRDEAGRKIREIMSDLKGPYFNENDPRHKDVVAEVTRLYQINNPEG